jgi:predicted DNA-binding transcriptional regulator AlpA
MDTQPQQATHEPARARAALSHVEAAAYLGIGKTKYFELRATDPTFPKPVLIGGLDRMLCAELDAWITARIAEREAGAKPKRSRAHLAAESAHAAKRSVAARRHRRSIPAA